MLLLLVITTFIVKFDSANAHGYMIEPAARSSAWRVDSRFPAYYNDMEMFCGGFVVQWNQNGGKCGICGENFVGRKRFEKYGDYYTGISVRRYKQGQIITISVQLTANHLGWFEFKICNIDGKTGDATQNCLDQTVLQDVSGQNRIPVNGSLGKYVGRFKLPPQLVCQQCVLQWKYHTGNRWGVDPVTGNSCLGCSPQQEQFYGCADVTIVDPNSKTTFIPTTFKPTPQNALKNRLESSGEKVCSKGDGYYAEKSNNCRTYYLCSNSNTENEEVKKYWCEENLLFDETTKNCNWPSQVKC